MRKKLKKIAVSGIILALLLSLCACTGLQSEEVTVKLEKTDIALRNPLKGIRSTNMTQGDPFSSLSKWYIEWNKIESSKDDGVEAIIEYTENEWYSAAVNNTKVIPRVYLHWPGKKDTSKGAYWPQDMTPFDYKSEEFQARVEALVAKMGQAWDHDPRVAFIEMGIIGEWGEQHSPVPTQEVLTLLADLFKEHFKQKLVMVRYPQNLMFWDYDYGYYWDEWGSEAQWSEWADHMDIVLQDEYADRWKTCVFGGENTNNGYGYFNGGRFKTFGKTEPFSPDEGFSTAYREMVNYARLTHTNHMGTRYGDEMDPDVLRGMTVFQNTLGYHFVIPEATYTGAVKKGGELNISFNVINKGASPIYYDWPVQFALLDPLNGQTVYRDVFDGVSAADWMPGDKWNLATQKYDIPAEEYQISESFKLPGDIPKGEYLLTVSILDPAGMSPAACFASGKYKNGAKTVLGKVLVGTNKPRDIDVWYDFPQGDGQARYYENIGLMADCKSKSGEAPETTDGVSTNAYVMTGSGKYTLTVDLGDEKKVKSAEFFWSEIPDYKVEVSANGKSWKKVEGRNLEGKNNVTRNIIDMENMRYVRVKIDKTGNADLSLYQFNVYGE